jgi:biopolymer transport protein ExbD
MKLKRDKEPVVIPTSSMADIAFLLIIFFMVTTVFSATKGLEFKLPKEDDSTPPESEEAVFIKVYPNSSITVDCKPMGPENILDYLEPKLKADAKSGEAGDPVHRCRRAVQWHDRGLRRARFGE